MKYLYTNKNLLIIAIILGILSSCTKDESVKDDPADQNEEVIDPTIDVYVAGYFNKTWNFLNNNTACYWKNGEQFSETDQSKESRAFDILVNNGNVYMAGSFNNKPCYWINNERFDIDDQNQISGGWSSRIYLAQGKLYILGNLYLLPTEKVRGFIWTKDGASPAEINISETREAYVHDWDFANNHFYIADEVNGIPGYGMDGWANHTVVENGLGHPVNLSLYNQDIFLSGAKNTKDNEYEWGFWKNGDYQSLNLPLLDGQITEMIIDPNGQVYQVGQHRKSLQDAATKAAYWKNGTMYDLVSENDQSQALDIAMDGTDIYIAGVRDGIQGGSGKVSAGYWKNQNTWINFDGIFPAVGTAIYLVKK